VVSNNKVQHLIQRTNLLFIALYFQIIRSFCFRRSKIYERKTINTSKECIFRWKRFLIR